MPIDYARRLTGKIRTKAANRQLGLILAFVAGAVNAGGFLAVRQYTSHMSGIVSAMADHVALGEYALILAGIGTLVSFLWGAACSAMLVNYSRRRALHSEFALPLLVEAVLLLCVGLRGEAFADVDGLFVSVTIMLLSFMMGLQNAVITKLSNAEIRTTHITGTLTDIGIELGKLFYWNWDKTNILKKVSADRSRLGTLAAIATLFFVGGVVGAVGFHYAGYVSLVPLACLLISIVIIPIADDVNELIGR